MRFGQLVAVGVMSLSLLGATCGLAEGIGVVDNVRVLENYEAYKQAQAQIIESRRQLDEKFSSLRQSLKTELEDASLSEAEKLQRQKAAQDTLVDEKRQFDVMVNSLREGIEDKVAEAVRTEAQAQGLDMVLSKGVTYYGGKDITDQVINRLQ